MRRQFLLFLFFLFPIPSIASESDHLRVSLLTCSTGPDLHAAFGHTAIRIIDSKEDRDLVFDYGIFDFNTPFFLWKFLSGDLQYRLSAKSYSTFENTYKREGRGITERIINLTAKDKLSLYDVLKENHKIENRYYDYEFFNQNCATKVRDKLIEANQQFIDPPEIDITYRKGLHSCLEDKPWLQLGIDIILGTSVDRPLSHREAMFFPSLLEEHIAAYPSALNPNLGILDDDSIVLLEQEQQEALPTFLTPMMVLLALLIGLQLLTIKRRRLGYRIGLGLMFVFGLVGVLLLLMWLGSRHEALGNNWNIIWANPIYLILPFLKRGRFFSVLVVGLLVINFVFLPLMLIGLLPQEINTNVAAFVGFSIGTLITVRMDHRRSSSSA